MTTREISPSSFLKDLPACRVVDVRGASLSLVGPLRLLAGGLSSVLRPRLALAQGGGAHQTCAALRKAVTLQLAVGLALFFAALALGERLVTLVFGDGFAGGGLLLPLAVVYATVEGMAALLVVSAQTRYERGAMRATSSRAAAGFLAIVALGLLAPQLGAPGALWAMILGELAFVGLLTRGGLHEPGRVRSSP